MEFLKRTASFADVRYPAESKWTPTGTLSNKTVFVKFILIIDFRNRLKSPLHDHPNRSPQNNV